MARTDPNAEKLEGIDRPFRRLTSYLFGLYRVRLIIVAVCIVVASVAGEFTVKELQTRPVLRLLPHNARYQPITFQSEEELQIFGVVTHTLKTHKHVRAG